jgi:alpha-tubulin suppressor-like RCC1 family protein
MCALLNDGTARCWGNNYYGQLGDGTRTDRHTPEAVSGLAGAVAIAAGDYHTCALLNDGTVRCWGPNSSGQLGDGTTTDRLTPVAVSGL